MQSGNKKLSTKKSEKEVSDDIMDGFIVVPPSRTKSIRAKPNTIFHFPPKTSNKLRTSFHDVELVIKEKDHQQQPTVKTWSLPSAFSFIDNYMPSAVKEIKTSAVSLEKSSQHIKSAMTEKKKKKYFFKHNPLQDNKESPMSALEVVNNSFYQFLIPKHVTSSRAHLDENNHYVGVSSQAIPGFKSVRDKRVTSEDFDVSFRKEKNLTILDMEKIDAEVRKQGFALAHRLPAELIPQEYLAVVAKEFNLSVGELKRFRRVKGYAKVLTASAVFQEDDLHRGNLGEDEEGDVFRIDFDMSEWHELYEFKANSLPDRTFRNPHTLTSNLSYETRFPITESDIRDFPILKDAAPFYWPTKPAPVIPKPIFDLLSKIYTISTNPFENEDIQTFQGLTSNEVFIYYKFQTRLKYILTEASMYSDLAKLNIEEMIIFNGKNIPIIERYTKRKQSSIEDYFNTLTSMSEFHDFLMALNDEEYDLIMQEFRERNRHFDNKITKYGTALKNLTEENEKKLLEEKINTYKKLILNLKEIEARLTTIKNKTIDEKHKNSSMVLNSFFSCENESNTSENEFNTLYKSCSAESEFDGFVSIEENIEENKKEFFSITNSPASSTELTCSNEEKKGSSYFSPMSSFLFWRQDENSSSLSADREDPSLSIMLESDKKRVKPT